MGWIKTFTSVQFYDSIEARKELYISSFFQNTLPEKKRWFLYFCQKRKRHDSFTVILKRYLPSASSWRWQFLLDLFDYWVIIVRLQASIPYRLFESRFCSLVLALESLRLCLFSCYFLIWLHSLSISDRISLLFTTCTPVTALECFVSRWRGRFHIDNIIIMTLAAAWLLERYMFVSEI